MSEVPWGDSPPKTRADCINRPRPCPWVRCKHHVLLDVNPKTGTIKVNAQKAEQGPRRKFSLRKDFEGWRQREPRADDEERSDEISDALVTMEHSCVLDLTDEKDYLTLDDVGEVMCLTRERARQIEAMGLRKIIQKARDDSGIKEMLGRV